MLFRKLTLAVIFCLGTFTVQVASAFDLPSYFKSDKLLETPKIPHHSKAVMHFARVNNSGVRDVNNSMVKNVILQNYRHWEGVKYLWGGDSKYGIDCSAFTRRVLSQLKINLPRTTSEQIHSGNQISKQQLKIGDLVFFKTSSVTRHVGIYVGNGQFIHASKSMGVTTSRLDENYWLRSYETSVRVI